MKHADFKIGMKFRTFTGTWVVTDIGTRVIVAIREQEGWMEGPPYAQAETVFDEDDVSACVRVL